MKFTLCLFTSKCPFNGYGNLTVNFPLTRRLMGTLMNALSYRGFANTIIFWKNLTEMLTNAVVNGRFVNKVPDNSVNSPFLPFKDGNKFILNMSDFFTM